MADFPWMKWFPRDYIADTRHLTPAQRGCYSDLLNYLFLQHGSLPDDDVHLSRMCGIDVSNWRRWIRPGIENLFAIEDGTWSHQRVLDSLSRASRTAQARKLSGSVGGTVKALNAKQTDLANATNLLQQNSSKPLARGLSDSESDSERKKEPPIFIPPEGKPKTKSPRKSYWPDGLSLTAKMREYAIEQCANVDADADFERWRLYCSQNAKQYANWESAWQYWCRTGYNKPLTGANGNERTGALQQPGAKPGVQHKGPASFVEASREVLALRSRQS